MTAPVPPDPDLRACTRALLRAGARFVIIGGFAVVANDFVRATEDVDVLIPDDPDNDVRIEAALLRLDARWPHDGHPFRRGELSRREHARLVGSAGLIALLRERAPPLDFSTVAATALQPDLGDGPFAVAGLESLVAFKRLAGRPRDKLDLLELEARHGPLPMVPLQGVDDG